LLNLLRRNANLRRVDVFHHNCWILMLFILNHENCIWKVWKSSSPIFFLTFGRVFFFGILQLLFPAAGTEEKHSQHAWCGSARRLSIWVASILKGKAPCQQPATVRRHCAGRPVVGCVDRYRRRSGHRRRRFCRLGKQGKKKTSTICLCSLCTNSITDIRNHFIVLFRHFRVLFRL